MTMTELMRRAVARASRLPAAEQNALAAFVLAELEGPTVWEAVFGRDDEGGDDAPPDDPGRTGEGPDQARRLYTPEDSSGSGP